MKQLLLLLIAFYQHIIGPFLKTLLGTSWCRYQPSCSEYSKQMIQKYGTIKGVYLSTKRLLSCHPFARTHYKHA